MTTGFFDVKDMAGINRAHGYAGGDRLLRQIGGLIARLLRGEDLSVRYAGEEFCVVMPDTPREPAEIALRRIANIVNHTDFGLPGVCGPVNVWMQLGCASFRPGDSAESLIARARERVE